MTENPGRGRQALGSGCCTPAREPLILGTRPSGVGIATEATSAGIRRSDRALPGGSFLMGDAFGEGYPSDGEPPVHEVNLAPFRIDVTSVTNRMFAKFIQATGYRTEADQYGSSAVFHLLSTAAKTDVLGAAAGAPWWLDVRGASWSHPTGPDSQWEDIPDHPVVHVSHSDALAYCRWSGRRLPTEAEWEYSARGGLAGKRYAWGNELTPVGEHQCNIWQGTFPVANTQEDGHLGTAEVKTFPRNGFGLYEMAGNVWEWCNDWFLPKYYRNSPSDNPKGPTIGPGRVMRGGSYLCHDSNTPESSSGNCGFRTVALR